MGSYEFTNEQRRAIEHRTGHLQLVACAGSGKTEVLARRVVGLLDPAETPAFEPANIIAFTFTEKAAAELKQRIVERVHERYGELPGMAEMFVGTIHAYCLELLKTEVPEYMKCEVLNEVQQGLFVDRNSQKSGLRTTKYLDGKTLRRYVDTGRYVAAMSILREAEVDWSKLDGTFVEAGLRKYEALLTQHGYLDYTGIMARAVEILEKDSDLQSRLAERVKQVFVDEYQDVNPVQERLVRCFAYIGASICVVGDDDQTIYQWRGSDVRNILTFSDRYPDVVEVRLQENFRSSDGVVSLARDFIAQNDERLEKAMIPTDAQKSQKYDICALKFDDPNKEGRWIAETAKALRGTTFRDPDGEERGLAYSDMAILLRSVKNCGQPITDMLDEIGVPYVVMGMNNLFATAEAQAARDLFYFVADAESVDRDALKGSWMGAELGIEESALEAAIDAVEAVKTTMNSEDQGKTWSFYNVQRQYAEFLETVGLREERVPESRGEVVFYNLGKFSQLISDFEAIHFKSDPKRKYQEFAGFLKFQAEHLYPEGWQTEQYANPDAVKIMTVHQAKGMQWPVVFVPALTANRFPAKGPGGKSVWHLIPQEAVGGADRYRGGVEDERRLFYVAITRSQKFLFMTWAPVDQNRLYKKASPFWEDMLGSSSVKRRLPDFSDRARSEPRPKHNIQNVTLSFSELKYYFECPYQFKLRLLYGFNAPLHEALGYGKSLHDALAEVHARAMRGDIADSAEAARLVETHLHVPYAYPALKETLKRHSEKVLRDYFEDQAADLPNIEFSEKHIEINLGDGIRVAGRIDLVRRIDTGEVTIVDLKSTERAQEEEVTETQLHIYALGYRELTGRVADKVEVYNLDKRKGVPRSVDDEFMDDVQRDVRKAAEALRSNELPRTPVKQPDTCASCDYRGICAQGCSVQPAERSTPAVVSTRQESSWDDDEFVADVRAFED